MKNFKKLSDAQFVSRNRYSIHTSDSRQSGKFKQDSIISEFSRIANTEVSENNAVAQSMQKSERFTNYVPTVVIDRTISPKFQTMEISPLTKALMKSVTGNSKEKKELANTSGPKNATVKIQSMPNRGLNPEVRATVKISKPKNTFEKSLRELDIPESVIMACIRKAAAKVKSNPSSENDALLTFLRSNSAKLVTILRKELKSGKELKSEIVAWIA